MPRIKYEERNFQRKSLELIAKANEVIAEFQGMNYDLTLRQLYYQLVASDVIPNKQTEYDNLGRLISNARRAGLIDWNAIVDRTRELRRLPHWDDAADAILAIAQQFRLDLWAGQDNYVEVWFEKDALLGVFERASDRVDVPYFSCRGYASDSEVWAAANRFKRMRRMGREPIVLHFGDHDPSGIDMTRDIGDRLALFGGAADVRRLALNMDQIKQYDPPPNPAKESDSRYAQYCIDNDTESSWELDALRPNVLGALVRDAVVELVDRDQYDARIAEQADGRGLLKVTSDQWDDVESFLRKKFPRDVIAAIETGNDDIDMADLDATDDGEEDDA
jgi:hypothetical protein